MEVPCFLGQNEAHFTREFRRLRSILFLLEVRVANSFHRSKFFYTQSRFLSISLRFNDRSRSTCLPAPFVAFIKRAGELVHKGCQLLGCSMASKGRASCPCC